MRKSVLMRRVERQQGEQIETLLPRLVQMYTAAEVARILDVSHPTVYYWLLKLGLRLVRTTAPIDRPHSDNGPKRR